MFSINCGHVCQLSGIMAIDFAEKKKKRKTYPGLMTLACCFTMWFHFAITI